MRKPRLLIAGNRKVISGSGLALAVECLNRMEVAGRDGDDVLKEAAALQPDLLLYLLSSDDESEYLTLKELKERCSFSTIVIHTAHPFEKQSLTRFLAVCHGCLQGMIPPPLLLSALELLCRLNSFSVSGTRNSSL